MALALSSKGGFCVQPCTPRAQPPTRVTLIAAVCSGGRVRACVRARASGARERWRAYGGGREAVLGVRVLAEGVIRATQQKPGVHVTQGEYMVIREFMPSVFIM